MKVLRKNAMLMGIVLIMAITGLIVGYIFGLIHSENRVQQEVIENCSGDVFGVNLTTLPSGDTVRVVYSVRISPSYQVIKKK
jgi:hypothetical protein